MVLWSVKSYYQEGAGHRCQFYLAGKNGSAGQVGQFPVLAQNQVAAIDRHHGGTLVAILAVQHIDVAVSRNVQIGRSPAVELSFEPYQKRKSQTGKRYLPLPVLRLFSVVSPAVFRQSGGRIPSPQLRCPV